MILLQDMESTGPSYDETIYRKNIMAGLLVKQEPESNIKNVNVRQICRKMLFYKDSYNVAIDLLYESPYYKIEGYNNKITTKEDFIIINPIELNLLLNYNGFDSILDEKDIKKIYSKFLRKNRKNYYLENCGLFGYQVEQQRNIKIKKGKLISSTSTIITETENTHILYKKYLDLIDIIDNTRKPSPLEQENGKIKAKVLTLFD